MKTILVGVDYSESSKNAALYGLMLAKASQANVILQHVYILPTPVSEVPYLFTPFDEIQKENETELKKLADELSEQAPGIDIQTIVSFGLPASTIMDTALENDVDLIVLGLKQHDGIDKFIGSTAEEINRISNIAILAIPVNSVFQPIKNITYATDLSFSLNRHGVKTLRDFLETFGANLQVVNVKKSGEIDPATKAASMETLKSLFEGYNYDFFTYVHKNIEHGVRHFLIEHQSQMLAMVAHRHNFIERIFGIQHTKEMMTHSFLPLLILNDKRD